MGGHDRGGVAFGVGGFERFTSLQFPYISQKTLCTQPVYIPT